MEEGECGSNAGRCVRSAELDTAEGVRELIAGENQVSGDDLMSGCGCDGQENQGMV